MLINSDSDRNYLDRTTNTTDPRVNHYRNNTDCYHPSQLPSHPTVIAMGFFQLSSIANQF